MLDIWRFLIENGEMRCDREFCVPQCYVFWVWEYLLYDKIGFKKEKSMTNILTFTVLYFGNRVLFTLICSEM